MTRRWKPKRRRMEQMLEPGNLEARPMWRDILPLEMWQIVFSFCLPTTLFAVRNTCHLFREIVDRDDGRLLAHAPLLLRRPPPDPRWWLRLVKHRGQAKVMREFFGVKNPRTPGLYGSAVYTNLIFRSGRCAMCNAWTAGPPEWIHSRIYLCTKKCKIMFFRTEVVYIQPRHNYLPARSATPHIDRHIIPWLPMVWMPLINTSTNAVLVRDLVAAKEEYAAEVLSASSPEERSKRREKLFKQYAVRYHWSCALFMASRHVDSDSGVFYASDASSQFQAYVNLWKESTHVDLKKLKAHNVRLLRKIAARRGVPALRAMRDPVMERILRARSRDRRRLSPSAFTKAGLTGAKGKKRICAQCRVSVPRSLYDWHVKQRHPERLPQCRLNFKIGKAEYRCDLCDGSPVKWFTANALGSHGYYKHGIRRARGHEWRGFDG